MSSMIVGLDGRSLDEEKHIVDPMGREVCTTASNEVPPPDPNQASPTSPPIDAVTQARMQFQNVMGALMHKCGSKTMSRGDLAETSRLLAQANHLNFQILSMAMSDVVSLIHQFEEQKFTAFMLGNQIATTLELLLEKGMFTKEELDAKWKQVAERAKAQINQMQQQQQEEQNDTPNCEQPNQPAPEQQDDDYM